MKADLHIHTDASDGTDSAREAVRSAAESGLDLIAITDHDTVAAVETARKEGEKHSLFVVSGIEISAYGRHEMHILGYNMNLKEPRFLKTLERLKAMRKERISRILKLLKAQGIIVNETLPENAGRAHIAKRILEAGYVSSIREAFEKYLGNGKSCFVESGRVTPEEAISAVKESGGLAVLAHPVRFKSEGNLKSLLAELKEMGLDGVETYYPSHSKSDEEAIASLADKFSLLKTGGSDHHGGARASTGFTPEASLIAALGIDRLTRKTERNTLS